MVAVLVWNNRKLLAAETEVFDELLEFLDTHRRTFSVGDGGGLKKECLRRDGESAGLGFIRKYAPGRCGRRGDDSTYNWMRVSYLFVGLWALIRRDCIVLGLPRDVKRKPHVLPVGRWSGHADGRLVDLAGDDAGAGRARLLLTCRCGTTGARGGDRGKARGSFELEGAASRRSVERVALGVHEACGLVAEAGGGSADFVCELVAAVGLAGSRRAGDI